MSYFANMLLNIIFWMSTTSLSWSLAWGGASARLALLPQCTDKCGDVTIPYPFGIEEGCYLKEDDDSIEFKIVCNYSVPSSPKPILGRNLEVVNISMDGELTLLSYSSYNCYKNNVSVGDFRAWTDMASTFPISSTKNKFVAIGCDTFAWFNGVDQDSNKTYYSGCMTVCSGLDTVVDGACNGVGCCESFIPHGITNISASLGSFYNHSYVPSSPCSSAFAIVKDSFYFDRSSLNVTLEELMYQKPHPVVFEWMVGKSNCTYAALTDGTYLCKENTDCYDLDHNIVGYRCKCKKGYSGNPYLSQGCQDDDECKNGSHDCEKFEYCVNHNGGYTCKCPHGYHGNGTKSQGCISNRPKWFTPVLITAGIGIGIISLLVSGFFLHSQREKSKLNQLRQTFFRQNGGLILHQKLSRVDGPVEFMKLFSSEELIKATNNYSDENIVGRGGFGIVYKGTLPDNQVVAIKKSLKVDPSQVEQFINEVIVLSQINNRNVVKLLGCCLETEVPLLVYEYIRNGTLFDHLHDQVKVSQLTWPVRLKIATEVAHVLSYLHTTISTPIIHRDMKSMNILLDEHYTAKVSDFGASRLSSAEEQGQLATMVLGTRGYLDPEYMQTTELTEKSDVYSFGVVLVELLTRRKAISYDRPEVERCLAMYFLVKMKENRLLDIIDKAIVKEEGAVLDQIEQVASLARWCLKLKGEDRPTMREVALELEGVKRMGWHPWYNSSNAASLQEESESLLGESVMMNSGEYSGATNTDLYKPPHLVMSLGDGR